jgi:hypothetical protein
MTTTFAARTMSAMRNIFVCGAVIALALLTGCARARVTTEIHPDGSWTRTVLLTGSEKKEGSMAPSIDDTFVFPSGPGWKATDGKQQNDITKTFERTVAAGGSLKGDLSVREDTASAKLKLVNEVTVTRVGPRRFEYRETLRWTGAPPKDTGMKPADVADIKALLPKALATDANARALAERTYALAMPMMFGPGEPLLAISLMHPDLAERHARQRIGTILLKALEEQFGNQMQPAERRELARKLIDKTFASTRPSQPGPSAGQQKNSSLTPLMFVLRAPGKLVSSNGEFDELSGEVYWALFPEAASMQPVVLTAVFELP